MMDRFALCFHDERRPEYIEHEVATLVGQRLPTKHGVFCRGLDEIARRRHLWRLSAPSRWVGSPRGPRIPSTPTPTTGPLKPPAYRALCFALRKTLLVRHAHCAVAAE
jgi:hypothetical protein